MTKDYSFGKFKQAKIILEDDKLVNMYIKITYLFKYWDKFEN